MALSSIIERIKANFPNELHGIKHWVAWTYETDSERPDKLRKVPKIPNPSTENNAAVNKPSTWGLLEQAIETARQRNFDGVGFMLAGEYNGVDLDHCRNKDTGEIEPWAQEIINRANSYTEESVSGTGVHIWYKGHLPISAARRKRGNVEVFNGGYFTVTGTPLNGEIKPLMEDTEFAMGIIRDYIDKPVSKRGDDPSKAAPTPCDNQTHYKPQLLDHELIAKACKDDEQFNQLWRGNWQGRYPSPSEADLSLCCKLAFWTGKDLDRMDTLFRLSGLMRTDWDGPRGGGRTYGTITLDKALERQTAVYDPEAMRKQRATEYRITFGVDSHSGGQQTGQTSAKPDQPDQPDDGLVRFPDDHTDQGNAVAFADTYKDLFYYVDGWGWTSWNGRLWEKNALEQAKKAFMRMCDNMKTKALADVAEKNDDPAAIARLKWALKSRHKKQITDALCLAQALMLKRAEEFDACEFDLNTPGGIVDLRTGTMRASDPKALCTCMTKFAPSNEPCPDWKKFLDYVTGGDAELIEYLQLVAGMAAVGAVYLEGFVIAHGAGGNGKSTLFNVLYDVLGGYSGTVPPDLLMVQQNKAEPIGLAAVKGKRFVLAAETEENNRLSASTMKRLAATDSITGRVLYQNNIAFKPTHTLVLTTNHLPKISSTDHGTWRRILTIPFEKRIERDMTPIRDYAKQLQEREGASILAWIIEGARKFYAAKCDIVPPEAVRRATEEYQKQEDRIGCFIDERCKIGQGYSVPSGALYEAYRQWAIESGDNIQRQDRFKSSLEDKGFTTRRTSSARVWDGLTLGSPQLSNKGLTVIHPAGITE